MTGTDFILINEIDDDETVLVKAIMRHPKYRNADPLMLAVELDNWSPALIAALAAALRREPKRV